jgi:hypothetical protein
MPVVDEELRTPRGATNGEATCAASELLMRFLQLLGNAIARTVASEAAADRHGVPGGQSVLFVTAGTPSRARII